MENEAFNAAETKDIPGRFRGKGEAIGRSRDKQVFLSEGPAMWLRLMPSINPKKQLSIKDLEEKGANLLLPVGTFILFGEKDNLGFPSLEAPDGFGKYYCEVSEQPVFPPPPPPNTLLIDSLAFAFLSGEIWSIDLLAPDRLSAIRLAKPTASNRQESQPGVD